ncbi:cytochrome P450 [Streptomyces sp. NPDC002004]
MTLPVHDEPVAYPFEGDDGLALSEAYAAAREADGLIPVQLPYGEPTWLVTRYADARFVMGDARFSRAMAAVKDAPRLTPDNNLVGILSMDPPEHTYLRALVAKALTPRRAQELRPRVREIAERLIDDMVADGQPADLVEGFSMPLPFTVMCELLGVPEADRPMVRSWSDAWLSTSPLTVEEFGGVRMRMREYMRGLIEEHRKTSTDNMASRLIEISNATAQLSDLELAEVSTGILTSGHENAASQISNFVHVLLERPENCEQLRKDPELIPDAVEELNRFVPLLAAGGSFPRYAKEDVEVGGVLVRAGEPVLVSVSAANRDVLQFDAPEALVFDRENRQHVGFGHGVHHCPGAGLSRLELQEALRALLAKLPGLTMAGEVVWKTPTVVRAPRIMPVGW